MKLIIGITGLHQDTEKHQQTIGAGKDAAASRLIDKHGFVRIGIADHIKRICKAVFDFSDEQLWGPSGERNKPDFRYLRGGKNGKSNREQLDAFKQDLGRLQRAGHDEVGGYGSKVKDLQRNIMEWEAMAYLTPRYALQQLGTEWGRNCCDSVWIDDALRIANALLSNDRASYTEKHGLWEDALNLDVTSGVVFSDVRFHNEFAAIKEAGGKLVRVRRFSWKPFENTFNNTHQSETELLGYTDDQFDYILDNGGDLPHLYNLVDRMLTVFKGQIIPYDEAQEDVPPALRGRKSEETDPGA